MPDNNEAIRVMFEKLDFYDGVITALQTYLSHQVEACQVKVNEITCKHGKYNYETGFMQGYVNAYSDCFSVLRDLIAGCDLDI